MDSCSKIDHIKIQSNILDKEMGLTVYTPASYGNGQRLPVLYFLHGRSGDENIMYELDIRNIADRMISESLIKPLIIVCPRMENSRGLNSAEECHDVVSTDGRIINLGRYEDYFIKEIMAFVDGHYNTWSHRNGRFIGGVSAGGYAALNLGMRYPDLFSRIGGHMPAVELQLDEEDMPYFKNLDMWRANNPLLTAAKCSLGSDCKIYIDAGDEDEGGFYNGYLRLYKTLNTRGIDVQNHIFKGHHNMEYIKSNIEKYIAFYGS